MTCIKGRGFDSQTGGFAVILVDEKEVSKSVVAAAPDLLAALELAEATIIRLTSVNPNKRDSVQGTLDVSRAAIAKAWRGKCTQPIAD